MNKTVTVNIGGFSFVIDETAYDLLQRYLARVKQKLSGDSAEIMQDIELRIAELLKERITGVKEVVDESDIEYIQSVMGQPEDFEDEESASANYDTYEEATEPEKALFRDMDNALLGGVCSGLAKYFNIDPVIMRIIFVFFAIFLGSGILLYIILLILIPEAKTTAQKLKMNGEAINLESIKSHFNKLGTDLNDRIRSKQFSRKVNSATSKTVQSVSVLANAFGKIIGIAFTIFGLVSLIFLVLYLTGSKDILPFTSFIRADSFYDFLNVVFPSPVFVKMALICLIFVIGIPLVSLIFTGVKLVFGIQSKIPGSVRITTAIVFGVAVTFLFVVMVRTALDFSSEGRAYNVIEKELTADQLNINIAENETNYFVDNSAFGCCDYLDIKKDKIGIREVDLYVSQGSDSTKFVVKTIATSQGMTDAMAAGLASDITYDIDFEDNMLTIPSFILVNKDSKFRAQRLKIIVEVPIGKSVKLADNMKNLDCRINNEKRYRHEYYNNEMLHDVVWRANGYRMECEDCWD